MNRLTQPLDANSNSAMGLNFSGYDDAVVLAAGVAQTYTIPTGAKSLLFSATDDFYVQEKGGAAAVPVATTATGAAPILNPVIRTVGALTTISLISPRACIVIISSYL